MSQAINDTVSEWEDLLGRAHVVRAGMSRVVQCPIVRRYHDESHQQFSLASLLDSAKRLRI